MAARVLGFCFFCAVAVLPPTRASWGTWMVSSFSGVFITLVAVRIMVLGVSFQGPGGDAFLPPRASSSSSPPAAAAAAAAAAVLEPEGRSDLVCLPPKVEAGVVRPAAAEDAEGVVVRREAAGTGAGAEAPGCLEKEDDEALGTMDPSSGETESEVRLARMFTLGVAVLMTAGAGGVALVDGFLLVPEATWPVEVSRGMAEELKVKVSSSWAVGSWRIRVLGVCFFDLSMMWRRVGR